MPNFFDRLLISTKINQVVLKTQHNKKTRSEWQMFHVLKISKEWEEQGWSMNYEKMRIDSYTVGFKSSIVEINFNLGSSKYLKSIILIWTYRQMDRWTNGRMNRCSVHHICYLYTFNTLMQILFYPKLSSFSAVSLSLKICKTKFY